MKIAVIDDEIQQLRLISQTCREYAESYSVDMSIDAFSDSEDFLKKIQLQAYTLAFIDIYIDSRNGIEIAERLIEKNRDIIIVFLTASPDFMPQAFSLHAFEYVLKPYAKERIFKVLNDAVSILPNMTKFIEIVCDRKKVQLALNDIMYIVSDAHYLNIKTSDETVYRTRLTVSELLMAVNNDPKLLAVNKGIVLNIDYIGSIENSLCVLHNGEKFPIKIRERARIEALIRDYIFKKLRQDQQ